MDDLLQKEELIYESDYQKSSQTESHKDNTIHEIMPVSDPLNFEYLNINKRDDKMEALDCNVMTMFNPNFEHKALAQHFGNMTHPSKIINPNSLKVFKQPAKIQFIVDTGKPVFALGDLEPWFCTLALYDLTVRKKISENFYFDHNDSIKEGLLGVSENTKFKNLSKAIFSVESPSPDTYLVLIVEKVLQGDIDECRVPYLKATSISNKKKDIAVENVPKFCKRLGKYRQMFALSFLQVFDEKGNFRLEGQQEFNPVYPQNPKDDLFDLIESYTQPNKDKNKNFKKVSIPGACRLKVHRLQPQDFIPDRLDPSLYPYKTNKVSEDPKYSRDVQEFEQNFNKFPYTDYYNDLYVYPISANFSSFDKKVKSIAVKIELRENDDLATRPLKMVYGNSSFDQTLTTSALTPVIYKSRQPVWNSEIKVKLPHRLYKDHHLLFTFYQIAVNEPKSKKETTGVATVIGHSICLLYNESKIAQNNQGEFHSLPITTVTNLPNKYLEKMNELEYADNGKPLFTFKLQPLSTTLPQEDSLANFYIYYHLKEFFADDKLAESLEVLTTISPTLAIRSLPVMIAALVRVFCTRTGQLGIKALDVLLFVLEKIQIDSQCFHRQRTGLLHSYVSYAFENIKARFPVFSALTENFLQYMMLNRDKLKTNEEKKKIHFLSWWIFDTISKSFVLTGYKSNTINSEDRTTRFNKQYSNNFSKIVKKLWEILLKFICETITSKDFQGELILNQNMAIFVHELFSFYDRGLPIDLMFIYNDHCEKNITKYPAKAEVISLLKLEYFRIVSDYEHWIPVNLPLPLDFSLSSKNILETLQNRHVLAYKYIEASINEIKDFKSNDVARYAVNNLTLLFTKHDFDFNFNNPHSNFIPNIDKDLNVEELDEDQTTEVPEQIQTTDTSQKVEISSKKKLVAGIYSPLLLLWINNYSSTEKWKKNTSNFEKSEFYICLIWILKNLGTEHLQNWWRTESSERLLIFLKTLQEAIVCFQFNPLENSSNLNWTYSTKDILSKLVTDNTVKTPKLLEKKSVGIEKENSSHSTSRSRAQNFQVSLFILNLFENFTKDYDEIFKKDNSPSELFEQTLSTLIQFSKTSQSAQFLSHWFSVFYKFVETHQNFVFNQKNKILSKICKFTLKFCSYRCNTIRSEASSFMYFLILKNHQIHGNFEKTKTVATVSLSKLANKKQVKEGSFLKKALAAVAQYALKEYENTHTKLKSKTNDPNKVYYLKSLFVKDVQDLTVNLSKILGDTLKIIKAKEKGDPEITADLYCKVANGYVDTPELRITWLEELSSFQAQNGNFTEAALSMCHSSALVADFLINFKNTPIDKNIFQKLLPEISEFAEGQEEQLEQSSSFTVQSFLTHVRMAIKFLKTAQLYEFANDLYKIILPLYRARRSYRDISTCHKELEEFYSKIASPSESNRLFGKFYRVVFYGLKFGDLDGKEFVYKEPLLTHLYELKDRLVSLFSKEFGDENVVVIDHGDSIKRKELDDKKVYLQITALTPYFEQEELKTRNNHFKQSNVINKFYYQVPFNPKTGKVGQGETSELHMKKTIITTEFHFPYILKRIPITRKKEVIVTPIEIAISALQDRCNKLHSELNAEGGAQSKTLSHVLQGSVMVTVNEGTLTYAKVFLGKPSNYPQNFVEELKDTFLHFFAICQKALIINSKLIDPNQIELQNEMESGYKSLYLQVNKYISESNHYFLNKKVDTTEDSTSPRTSPQISPNSSPLLKRNIVNKTTINQNK
eukprot:TRINITY_DN4729_c0_g2_i1.p1 TRINITY_DN4729_c0_g2~~TRINITY_DN4729_c0_g2_i1.p1  ORF type:complete len:1936 (-),score=552.25 TRINITY_DN4729_c0_g2_i1:12-5237(-)